MPSHPIAVLDFRPHINNSTSDSSGGSKIIEFGIEVVSKLYIEELLLLDSSTAPANLVPTLAK